MFAIKVKNQFLDLAQAKFNVKMNSPFLFNSTNKDAIPASLLLTTKVGPTKKNYQILDNPHLITNPRAFLKNEAAEIWSNGSIIYFGKLDVTEASTNGDISIRVLINSLAELKDLNLQNIDFPTITGDILDTCNQSNQNIATSNFLCPAVYAPEQSGTTPSYNSRANFQNHYALISNPQDYELFAGELATICPFPKVTTILRQMIKHIGYDLANAFEDSNELKYLLLHYANPLFKPTLQHHDFAERRYTDINLKRHVPNMKSGDFLKGFIRHFNLGLVASNFENEVKIIKADDLPNTEPKHDWTKKVLKTAVIKEAEPFLTKFKVSIPSALGSNPWSVGQFDLDTNRIRTDYHYQQSFVKFKTENENKDYIIHYTLTNQTLFYRNRDTTNSPSIDERDAIVFNKDMNYPREVLGATDKNVYESKVSFLPSVDAKKNYTSNQSRDIHLPATNDKNTIGAEANPENSTLNLFFFRDSTEIPTGSSEAQKMDGTYWQNNGVNAKHDIAFGGENGVYNRFWKNWDGYLKGKRRLEIQLDLEIADLRRFSFEDKIFIGNYEGFAESIDIEFNQNGLSAVKAVLIC